MISVFDYNGFSKKIKAIRVEKEIKQEDVAKKLGISTNTYMSYENDPRNLKIDTLIELGNILDVNILDIFLQYIDTKCITEKPTIN